MSEKTRSDEEKPQHDAVGPEPNDDDLAERYGLGHPDSEKTRSERGPYFVRNPHGYTDRRI
ncbi:MAG: hypothetical protein A3J09_01505 [Candidatus Zambryskibacteria bacterium RIFCSPLOWO2_02_FULL_51_21]|uniref:Uncharacterized protein n=1 Tax=Candidatus Zambryskibacteria bacterium RIFCSPHIGHO2_02_FULL_43_37 TaxID=1802749 RepID=A0A1G2TH28_9BACT|nr:MAG: hypothetical protein A2723_01505 [Candidatus Zambryskibacteria bacterium RIFCSPHIGHO2_01_FULL_52_18]OHA96513.1 MAG: hypothetical protein A3D49_01395 [Candidatus Zambryskibacteria bacterium RIFCSPHIGHO2_02_FULL_43_37]OHB07183.1 MAG: hypothetical protein A2944_01160 [Candidatus Zambryskibacteria bacterium RIFCSPLOWO2_01_FULL_52_12]OHB11223.1 MAG: hypothetical protein A3J09_01505 [Candidatus Zambryskibacteria bacterium RIFCSPLOWO2_02_FULL_51_21]